MEKYYETTCHKTMFDLQKIFFSASRPRMEISLSRAYRGILSPPEKASHVPTIYNIIYNSVFLDNIENLREIIKERELAITKFKEDIRSLTNTDALMKKYKSKP